MTSKVDAGNRALSKLGEARITAFTDNTKQARAINSAFDIVRDAELYDKRWGFSIKRAALAADATAPTYGYDNRFQMPTDCLRVLACGEGHPGVDLSSIRGMPNAAYAIEGRYILTDQDGPLYLRYIARIEDTTQWNAGFVQVFACALALEVADELTASQSRVEQCEKLYQKHLRAASRAGAVELPPEDPQDDTWITSRSQG